MRTPAYLSREGRYAGVILLPQSAQYVFNLATGEVRQEAAELSSACAFFYSVLLPVDSRRIRSVCT